MRVFAHTPRRSCTRLDLGDFVRAVSRARRWRLVARGMVDLAQAVETRFRESHVTEVERASSDQPRAASSVLVVGEAQFRSVRQVLVRRVQLAESIVSPASVKEVQRQEEPDQGERSDDPSDDRANVCLFRGFRVVVFPEIRQRNLRAWSRQGKASQDRTRFDARAGRLVSCLHDSKIGIGVLTFRIRQGKSLQEWTYATRLA